jgi:glutathione S-transferase
VVLTAVLLNVKVELSTIDLLRRENRTEAYLEMNPNGKVPLLREDELFLWESHAIIQYPADKVNDQTLYPRDIQSRADEPLALLVGLSFHASRRVDQQRTSRRRWSVQREIPTRQRSREERHCSRLRRTS